MMLLKNSEWTTHCKLDTKNLFAVYIRIEWSEHESTCFCKNAKIGWIKQMKFSKLRRPTSTFLHCNQNKWCCCWRCSQACPHFLALWFIESHKISVVVKRKMALELLDIMIMSVFSFHPISCLHINYPVLFDVVLHLTTLR